MKAKNEIIKWSVVSVLSVLCVSTTAFAQDASDQRLLLAQQLHDQGVAVGEQRLEKIHAGASLTDPEIVDMLGKQFDLLNQAGLASLEDGSIKDTGRTLKEAIAADKKSKESQPEVTVGNQGAQTASVSASIQ